MVFSRNFRSSAFAIMFSLSWIGLSRLSAPLSSAAPSPATATPDPAARSRVSTLYGKLPLSFEANRGQTDKQVRFLSRGSGYNLFLTPTQAVLVLNNSTKTVKGQTAKSHKQEGTVLRLEWVGANQTPQIVGLQPLPGKSNYFTSKDPKTWQRNIPTYAKVQYRSVYPGIDLVYYGNQRQLEYDWVVAPGANPKQVRMKVIGADQLSLDKNGDLVLHTRSGEVRQHRPRIYQLINGQRQVVPGTYVLLGKQEVGLAVAKYDPSQPLVIDPVLSYSTYVSGSGGDGGTGIAVDKQGNAYITGSTSSTDFPTTSGAFQTTVKDDVGIFFTNAFVTKLNEQGSALIYSTYLGGSSGESGYGIAVDEQGNAYITGGTDSSDFPTTHEAFQTTLKGGSDAFVTKLNEQGSALIYSTYLGGSSFDRNSGIAVDEQGNAYITGGTDSSDFPTTYEAFQTTFNGGSDAFVTKLNEQGSALIYSTYLGGSSSDGNRAIAVDKQGNAYIAGSTRSGDFPTTHEAFQTTLKGGSDAFVTKLNERGSALVYSTYLGGSSVSLFTDSVSGIAVDKQGNAYITGSTFSTDFPTTPEAFQTTIIIGDSRRGASDAFVTKLNEQGSALIYSTYLGGIYGDSAGGIAVDKQGSAYIVGSTVSFNFPTTPDAFQRTLNGVGDAFVTKLNERGSALVYSTYLGGRDFVFGDTGSGIVLGQGSAYITGTTISRDFPTTPNAFQTQPPGQAQGGTFVTKISFGEYVTEEED